MKISFKNKGAKMTKEAKLIERLHNLGYDDNEIKEFIMRNPDMVDPHINLGDVAKLIGAVGMVGVAGYAVYDRRKNLKDVIEFEQTGVFSRSESVVVNEAIREPKVSQLVG